MGTRFISESVEAIIQAAVREVYLVPERPTFRELVRQVAARCRRRGEQPPDARTIRRRVEDIDPVERARLRKDEAAQEGMKATPGRLQIERPLDLVQIDHTQMDSGLVLAKGFYRLCGTAARILVTTALVFGLAQYGELFIAALAAWLGVCAFAARGRPNFASYGFSWLATARPTANARARLLNMGTSFIRTPRLDGAQQRSAKKTAAT